MPNLTDLKLDLLYLNGEFCTTLKAKASSIQVQTLNLFRLKSSTSTSSHHVGEALCSMPNLTDLKLELMDLNEEFCSTLKAKASSMQVQTLELHYIQCPTQASSHHLAEALNSMPNLTDLTLHGIEPKGEFYSTLKAKASSIQVQTLELDGILCPTLASSHHLAEAMCSMPNLTDLILVGMDPNEEFCSTLKAKASSMQIQTLKLEDIQCSTPASSHHLAEAMCCMPNLTDLKLDLMDLNEEFCSTLKAKASSIQGCFPQIRKGNFRFNGVAQVDLNLFLKTLPCLQSSDLDCSSDSDDSTNSGNSNDSDNSTDFGSSNDSYFSANSGNSNDSDEKVAAVGAGPARGNLLVLSQEFHRMILKFQRSNQSMKSGCYGIGRRTTFLSSEKDICYTMDGFCLLYLLLILLMRSGDVETNPGPNTAQAGIISKK
ncbi:uncharacterized protein LOC115928516 [Strongylocentrotus purpuratus]|uniref:Uncharacterized protein n=1 Tax=Strongylocentrotus purpuratus TaxID=7668 RepID=A0A7M7PJG2_STRPU|nr:uncharacterized protein LOC115928516 [Strongylocentrotus purpuratus]